MINSTTIDLLEKQFKAQYSRWSDLAWKKIAHQVLPVLIENMKSQLSEQEIIILVEGYLNLTAKAIGKGKLFVRENNNFANFTILAWEHLLPKWLNNKSQLQDKLELITKLWNIAESLDKQPAWVSALLIQHLTNRSDKFDDIEVALKIIEQEVLSPRDLKLSNECQPDEFNYSTITTTKENYFLPQALSLEAPRLLTLKGYQVEGQNLNDKFFYVLISNTSQIFEINQNLNIQIEASASKFDNLISNLTSSLGLKLKNAITGDDFIAAIFEGSEQLHFWKLKTHADQ